MPEPPPAGEPAAGADREPSAYFYEQLLTREIPGMEPPAADRQGGAHALFSTAVQLLTGIDPLSPCSVLDLELGAGRGVSLPAATPLPSPGPGGSTPPEVEPDPEVEPAPWGGALFPFPLAGSGEKKILLYHTHATESFLPGDAGTAPGRAPTVVTVGEELARILEESYGLPVLHHRAVYDQPRSAAYRNARPAVEAVIRDNPGLELVIDLHRDGVVRSKTTGAVEERELASFLLVHGCRNPGAESNLEFLLCLQRELEAVMPSLSRGILQSDLTYNQDLHPRAILIEVGGHENSITEAVDALPYLAEAIARAYYLLFLRG